SFVDSESRTANPVYHIFSFLGQMQGGNSLDLITSKECPNMITVAVQNSKDKKIRICIINKNENSVLTKIENIKSYKLIPSESRQYKVNEDGSLFAIRDVDLLNPESASSPFMLQTNGISVTMLTFKLI